MPEYGSMNAKPLLFPIGFLMIAALFVFIGYDSQLPVLDTDEGIILAQTLRERGLGQYQVMQVPGYPPLILGLYHVVQRTTEFITGESVLQHSELVIRVVRLLAALANLVTVYLIYRIGAKLLAQTAGYIAAFAWVILPSVHAQMHLALTEAWQALFITAAIWMMLKTLETRRPIWAISCSVFGLLAVIAKYSAFPALGFGVGVTLWLAWSEGRAWLWTTLIQIGMIVLCAYLLLEVYGASTLMERGNAEPARFARSGLQTLLDPAQLQYLFNGATVQAGLHTLSFLAAVLLIGTTLYVRQAPPERRVVWGLLLVFWGSYIAFVATFLAFDHLKERYFSPSSPALVLMITLTLTVVAQFASRRLNVRAALLLAVLCTLWLVPPLVTRSQEMLALTYPSSDRTFVEWSSRSLQPGTLAITGLEGTTWYWRYFNPIWGNYHGPQRPLVDILLYLQQPKEQWLNAGIQYVHLTENYPGDYPTLPFPREEMLFLKAFPPQHPDRPWRGDTFYIYRLQPIQNPLSATFGDSIELLGYDLNTQQVERGNDLTMRLYWKADTLPAADYHLYLHLSPIEVHQALAQADGTPALPERPTHTWDDPDETLISPQFTITVPADLPSGEYRLLVGLYRFDTGERLLTADGDDKVLLRIITVS